MSLIEVYKGNGQGYKGGETLSELIEEVCAFLGIEPCELILVLFAVSSIFVFLFSGLPYFLNNKRD